MGEIKIQVEGTPKDITRLHEYLRYHTDIDKFTELNWIGKEKATFTIGV